MNENTWLNTDLNYDDDKGVVVLFYFLFSPIYIINHHFNQTYITKYESITLTFLLIVFYIILSFPPSNPIFLFYDLALVSYHGVWIHVIFRKGWLANKSY